ncbi:hypothetical protein GKZ68_10900 [Hymenobacter sp. BRD128]|uniref:hypothetical protein n=1 Tax=Hymenobacter sp. BRD128 TaxID=2675878 RepID=UPI001565D520|nr:hypothetical protein [Hymenobacter sp. BRD128]QKG57091.1 hypothetical protein GKZ68_10900 [Hymenobacter sp. BRD128]
MKKLNQPLVLAATMLLMAGSAYAQAPTNTYGGNPIRPVTAPTNTHKANPEVSGASAGTYSKDYNAYSQDSYVSQTGSGNYATVDQVNTGGPHNGGSTAILDQNGDNNNATQTQSAAGDSKYYSYSGNTSTNRNFAKATQNGSKSQVDQTQSGGIANVMTVVQGAGTTGNRAIQTQGADAIGAGTGNQAEINQTHYSSSGSGSGNRAEQAQTGILQTAKIDQEGSNSYAKQTQDGNAQGRFNNAYIHQGDPGTANTAIQTQNGLSNTARIQQSVSSTANNNYALQNQTMNGNQADITQQSSNNYAEQQQSGLSGGGNNYSSIMQSNVASAAYTTQSGNNNAVTVNQH